MDQLLALDSLYLGVEDENVQANIGGVSIFEGPPPKIAELRQKAAGMFDQLPRCRQRILELPSGLGHPLWVDDEDFKIERHLFTVDLGRQVAAETVQDHFARTMSERLDRARPLWKIQVVKHLPENRWAILWTTHHAMVDGIAASGLMAMLLSFDPEDTAAAAEAWTPRPAPRAPRALASAFAGPSGPLKPLRDLRGGIRHPRGSAKLAAKAARGLIPVGRSLLTENENPLNGPIGPERIWRTAELSLAKVKLAGTLHHGTVNDVVLAAVTNGLRDHIARLGLDSGDFNTRTMVPVSIRSDAEQGAVQNRVSAVFVDLPVAIDDPVRRFSEITRQMDSIKQSNGESVAEVFSEAINYLPKGVFMAVESALLQHTDIKRLYNTVTTNVPGPQAPLHCLGRKMLSLHPYIMLLQEQRVSSAIFSYNGMVHFGITGDRDHVDDLSAICRGIEGALDELISLPEEQPPKLKLVA
jgi:WS/DGAT/MGAT family acyltransferase